MQVLVVVQSKHTEICILLHIITMTKQHTNARSCDSPQGDGAPDEIKVSAEMVAAGVKAFQDWDQSDEPDCRVLVRSILSSVLGSNVAFD